MRLIRLLSRTIVILLGVSYSLFAQTGAARLAGRVTDPQGRVVSEAVIEAVNNDTNVKILTKTNGEGIYYFSSLQPGNYRVIISKEGFKQVIQAGVSLHTQDELTLNCSLQIGSVSETVTVSENGDMIPIRDSPAVGLLVDRTFIENMPLNGRSFQDLIALTPGAVSALGTGMGTNDPGYSFNGQRTDANYFTVDGVGANASPDISMIANTNNLGGLAGTHQAQTVQGTTQALLSVDSLQEFKVQTSGYSAEYGREPGGQIALTSRSGTNSLHGSLYDYFRNTALDANSWEFNANGVPRQAEHQNDFGGTIGGPITIPGVYDGRNRTFYFVSYEGLRLLTPFFIDVSVPTPAFRQWVSTGWQPFLASLPLPNKPSTSSQCALPAQQAFSCLGEYVLGGANPSNIDQFAVRVDHVIDKHAQLFVRYSDTPSTESEMDSETGSAISSTSADNHSATAGITANVTSNVTADARFNYSKSTGTRNSNLVPEGGATPYPRNLLFPTQLTAPGAPVISFFDFAVPGANLSIPSYSKEQYSVQQYNLPASLAWARGKHSVKVGEDFRALRSLFLPQLFGSVLIQTTLQGLENNFTDTYLSESSREAHPIFHNLSLYAEDEWRLERRLVVSYGLRWEYNPVPGASDGLFPLALTTNNLTVANIAPSGTPQYASTYRNFAPRLGVSYAIIDKSNHPLTLRGSYGVFYDTGQNLGAQGYKEYPFFNLSISSNVPLPISGSYLLPPPEAPIAPPYQNSFGIGISGIMDPQLKLPYTEQWNVSVDQGLGLKNTLTMSYVGNEGHRLLLSQNLGNGNPGSVAGNPNFGSLAYVSGAASSSYNGLQIQDQGYIAPGAQLIAGYAFSHAIDDASVDYTGIGLGPSRGNSDFDIRHSFNLAFNYTVPRAGQSRSLRALSSGWILTTRLAAQTGFPIDLMASEAVGPNGSTVNVRPDVVPGIPLYLHDVSGVIGGWSLNPAAFTGLSGDGRVPAGTIPVDSNGTPSRQGTLGRNYLHGPGFWALNMAIQRSFAIRESFQLEFRADAFNILNHPNPGLVDNGLYDPAFGKSIRSLGLGVGNALYAMGAARSLQLSLRLHF